MLVATDLRAENSLADAKALLESAGVFDGHNDLAWVIREDYDGDIEKYALHERGDRDTDIPKLRDGSVGAQFWSVYVPSSITGEAAVRTQLEQIDLVHRLIRAHPDTFELALGADDVERINSSSDRIASLLGMEGGHTISDSLGVLRTYFELGVRYMTLTHFHSSGWADSATGEAIHDGLSPFGEDVVVEMNRLGMLVDIAHVSVATMSDVLDLSVAPVIFSHGATDALTPHPRNVPDRVLERLRTNGGVMMVTFIPGFVSVPASEWAEALIPKLKQTQTKEAFQQVFENHIREMGPSPRATIADVADHIEHVVAVAGIDHVGIGADFYGAQTEHEKVLGLEDATTYPSLFAELIRRGWSEDELRKLARGNILRVLREAEAVAAGLESDPNP